MNAQSVQNLLDAWHALLQIPLTLQIADIFIGSILVYLVGFFRGLRKSK